MGAERVAKLCARNNDNVVSRRVTLLRVTLYDRNVVDVNGRYLVVSVEYIKPLLFFS